MTRDAIADFTDAMRSEGVGPEASVTIQDDDKPHYYKIDGDAKGKIRGSYCLRVDHDGFAVGWFYDHKQGVSHAWHSKAKRGLSPEERAKHKVRIAEAKKKRDAEIKQQHDEAATRAADIWAKCARGGSTPYLDRKRIWLNGARIYKDMVAVPMFKDARMVGLQFITPDGEKRFLSGVDKTGSYHSMRGPDMSVIRICEGFATGAAIRICYPDNPVIVAWDAGNLKPVAKVMAGKYPDAQIVICGDNDQWRDSGNIGLEKSQQAAVAIGGAPVMVPPFPDDDPGQRTDWWDYWDAFGVDDTRDALAVSITTPSADDVTPFEGYNDDGDDQHQHLDKVRPMGISEDGRYVFFPRATGRIVELSATELGKLVGGLFRLVSNKNFWELHYGGDKSSSSEIAENASAHLMNECHAKGVWRSDGKRGVGTWLDDAGYVVNTGKRVVGHGIDEVPTDFKSEFVYESGVRVIDVDHDALTRKDSQSLYDLCSSLSWKRPEYGILLAGWIVCAGVGGALDWRPHIWITGPSGSGKSTVMDKIIKASLKRVAVIFDGGTTEAGVRKYLGSSSRPFIMDEAESESMRDRGEMDKIIGLFRKASSGGVIANANSTFNAQSCACFAAINPNVKEVADQARITLLELEKDKRPDAREIYRKIVETIHNLIDKDFDHRLFKYAFENIEVLTDNIKAFNSAAAVEFGNQRTADQLAPMIAGARLLHGNERLTIDEASDWIRQNDWEWFTSLGDESDSGKLVSHIMSSRIEYDVMGSMRKGLIGDMIDIVIEGSEGCDDIHRGLKAYGIKIDGEYIHIANTNKNMSYLLRDTSWVPWSRTLGDYPGCTNNGNKTVSFLRGFSSKVKSIPIDARNEFVSDGFEMEGFE